MPPKTTELQESYANHLNICWNEYIRFKETKDRIVFFIGTLFITVLFGSGFLILKSYHMKSEDVKTVFDKLYVLQYFLMHLFFLLLYIYYTYNNIQEKIFLIETQCCHYHLRTKFSANEEHVPVPFSLIKRYFCDGIATSTFVKGKHIKDTGNVVMFAIYFIFSTIPLWFKKDFILFRGGEPEVKFKFSWLIIAAIGIILLMGVIFAGTQLIKSMKKEILKKWEIPDPNSYKI